jgi:LuxR family transcriptional regulator, maltose regulon positive regulatory protein
MSMAAPIPDQPLARTFFLRTKLLPPRPTPAWLPRPRLLSQLQAGSAHPVTLVTANAGFGKTTLVAEFVRTQTTRSVWYQLDHTDADPFVFLGYLAHGFSQVIPKCGAATLAYLQQAPAEVSRHLEQAPERVVDVLLNEILERVEEPVVLVLDDYHHLGAETPVHALVDRLLSYLPDVIHTILISREIPPLSLSRLRSQAQLTIIDRADLLFTDDETQALFRQIFDLELTPAQLAEYRERTQGWITALQLVRQQFTRELAQQQSAPGMAVTAPPDLTEVLRQSERNIFEYFAEEVFAAEPEYVRELLLRLALLDRLDLETCMRLHPRANCAAILPALVRRNVFLTLATDGRGEEYRLHPLFRSFLRRRWRNEVGRAGIVAEQARIGTLLLEAGQWEQAMQHLLAAEAFAQAAAVLAERGPVWLAAGALSTLVGIATTITAEHLDTHPRALAHWAEVLRLRGEYDAAQRLFRRAATLLHEQGDLAGEADAMHSLATLARRRGDFATAYTYLDQVHALSGDRAPVRIKCGNTRGLCLVAQGQWTEAEREFRLALQAAEEQGDEHYTRLILHNLGLPAMMRGDFGEALRWLRRMPRHDQPIPQEATAHLNMARCYLYRGELGACERQLELALKRCQGFNLVTSLAEAFETWGNLHRERGEYARAAESYARAARTYEEAGLEPSRTELWEEQALLHLQMGEATTARTLLERLRDARVARSDELGQHTATLALSRVRLAQTEQAVAAVELEQALPYFRREGLYYYEAQACFLAALCAQAAGNEPQLLEHLRRAVELARRYDYDYWLRREVERHPTLFALPEAAELLPPELRAKLNTKATPPLTAAPEIPPGETLSAPVVLPATLVDLTIRLLGPIEIFRDPARPFAADAWTTRRARDILCFIVAHRHRRAAKEVLVETFWGEAEATMAEKNFYPTISHIRRALNSRQPLKQNFLVFANGEYQLNPEFAYAIDLEEFDHLVAESEAARRAGQTERYLRAYDTAVKLYRGEFMQGCYGDWIEEQRTYYRTQYLHMLETLAMAAAQSRTWAQALQLAQQVLRDDPFREEMHCLVMRAQAALGNRAALKEQYEHLRKLLREELGVEPAARTRKTFKQLFEPELMGTLDKSP